MFKLTKIVPAVAGLLLMAGYLYAQKQPAGYLGIIMKDVNDSIAAQQGLKNPSGVLVVDVVKESPAEKAGLLKNDIVIRLDGRDVRNTAKLWKMIGQNADKTVKVEGKRASAPLSLPITFGARTGKESRVTATAFNEESAGDQAEKDGHSREAVDHYINALEEQYRADEAMAGLEIFDGVVETVVRNGEIISRKVITAMGDDNFPLRQKIITIVLRLSVPPATPEKAERPMAIARAAQAEATDRSGYNKAIWKYAEASRCAPWLADLYFNLGVLCERNSYFGSAVSHFKLYLLAAPAAEDAQQVKDKIYLLEDKQKEQVAANAAAAKAAQQASKRESKKALIQTIPLLLILLAVGIPLLVVLNK